MTGQGWRRASRVFSVLTGLSVLAACSDDPYKAPVFPFLSSYKSTHASVPILLSNADWWKTFNDPTLNTLIETGLEGNLNLDIAKERVIEAKAIQRTVPKSAFLSPRAGVRRERGETGGAQTQAEAGLGFDWILDIYGGRRAQIDAAGARIEVADAEVDAARLLLLLNISNAYVDLRFQQTSLQLRRSELASRRQTLELIERLQAGNAATQVDVVKPGRKSQRSARPSTPPRTRLLCFWARCLVGWGSIWTVQFANRGWRSRLMWGSRRISCATVPISEWPSAAITPPSAMWLVHGPTFIRNCP